MPASDHVRPVPSARRLELLGTLALATDLGMGAPFEHGVRAAVITARLADRIGADDATVRTALEVALLLYAGCTTDSRLLAEEFGDEQAFRIALAPLSYAPPAAMARAAIARVGAELPWHRRVFRLVTRLPRLRSGFAGVPRMHCEVAASVAVQMSAHPAVPQLLGSMLERWDGTGWPGRLAGEQLPMALRLACVGHEIAIGHSLDAVPGLPALLRERSGAAFDPAIAELAAAELDDLLDGLAERSAWPLLLAAEPRPWAELDAAGIERALEGIADFADLVSPWFTGHGRAVADLAAAAAPAVRVDERTARWAGLVHDVGRVGVSVRVWDRAGPLPPAGWEQVRLHSYHAERILSRAACLAGIVAAAAQHHERLDGSGYHRGAAAAQQDRLCRLVAAADVVVSVQQDRPHRPGRPVAEAAELARAAVDAGELDADAVEAVVEAAGIARRRSPRPAGLTEREIDVLRLVAAGRATKQVATSLGISARTADHHLEAAYRKLGVSTRAAATLAVMQHGLITWGELPMSGPAGPP